MRADELIVCLGYALQDGTEDHRGTAVRERRGIRVAQQALRPGRHEIHRVGEPQTVEYLVLPSPFLLFLPSSFISCHFGLALVVMMPFITNPLIRPILCSLSFPALFSRTPRPTLAPIDPPGKPTPSPTIVESSSRAYLPSIAEQISRGLSSLSAESESLREFRPNHPHLIYASVHLIGTSVVVETMS